MKKNELIIKLSSKTAVGKSRISLLLINYFKSLGFDVEFNGDIDEISNSKFYEKYSKDLNDALNSLKEKTKIVIKQENVFNYDNMIQLKFEDDYITDTVTITKQKNNYNQILNNIIHDFDYDKSITILNEIENILTNKNIYCSNLPIFKWNGSYYNISKENIYSEIEINNMLKNNINFVIYKIFIINDEIMFMGCPLNVV